MSCHTASRLANRQKTRKAWESRRRRSSPLRGVQQLASSRGVRASSSSAARPARRTLHPAPGQPQRRNSFLCGPFFWCQPLPLPGSGPTRPAWRGPAWLGSARLGSARLGSARLGSARFDTARPGSARLGSARLGSARLGSTRLGPARLGSARLGSAGLSGSESSHFDQLGPV